MEGLLLRLSALDPDAEAAVRVIAYFDALVTHGASAHAVVRATAALAECPAGWVLGDGTSVRYAPDGSPLERLGGLPPSPPASAAVSGGGTVWLERTGEPAPLDPLVLERMAVAASTVCRQGASRREPAGPADPALVELVLSAEAEPESRVRALRLLGLAPGRPLRVAAVRGVPSGPASAPLARCGAARAVVDGVTAVLIQSSAEAAYAGLSPDRGTTVGVGGAADAEHARRSWEQARVALRFAEPDTAPVVRYDALGSLAMLAELPAQTLRSRPELAVVEAYARRPGGEADLAALAAFCRSGSLRGAATRLHLHHSSVADRVARAGDALGWDLGDPADRFRAMVALTLRRLARD
ncbi:PucR family transcriptional regulator [Yinghuangia sp. YIM S09857]|uniref:PucR family transcriptional regulator n=1 Tax=Yinghuangia sp. YIM S09857 TaxID=3436929 RepID=UPI003F529AA9